jgi:hypothetical protein
LQQNESTLLQNKSINKFGMNKNALRNEPPATLPKCFVASALTG